MSSVIGPLSCFSKRTRFGVCILLCASPVPHFDKLLKSKVWDERGHFFFLNLFAQKDIVPLLTCL